MKSPGSMSQCEGINKKFIFYFQEGNETHLPRITLSSILTTHGNRVQERKIHEPNSQEFKVSGTPKEGHKTVHLSGKTSDFSF